MLTLIDAADSTLKRGEQLRDPQSLWVARSEGRRSVKSRATPQFPTQSIPAEPGFDSASSFQRIARCSEGSARQ